MAWWRESGAASGLFPAIPTFRATPSFLTCSPIRERALEMIRRHFGAHRPVAGLDRRDWDGFIRDRRAGRVRPAGVKEGRPVKARAVEQDLRLLLAVFNWAVTVRDASGKRLLTENRFKGFTVPHEENPRRPILTHDEFEKLLAAGPSVHPAMETVLILADSTGHRINSIRMLRWSDIDFQANTIRWRGDQDKIGHEHVTPMVQNAPGTRCSVNCAGDARSGIVSSGCSLPPATRLSPCHATWRVTGGSGRRRRPQLPGCPAEGGIR